MTISTINFFASATATTPAWTVPNGMTAKVNDAAGAQTINVALGGMLDVQGALGANVFVFEGITDPVIALRNGSVVELSTTLGGIFAKIPATTTAQSVKFGALAAQDLQIVAGVINLNGVAVESVPVSSTFTVTDTAGVITFGGTATGAVTVTNTAGTLSFARDGVDATTTVALTAVTSLPAVTVAGTTTVADANSFDAKSTEIITATISDTAANLATLTGTGNAYAVTISGTTAATLAQLKSINNATTGAITLNAATIATPFTGSAADLAAALSGLTTYNAAVTVNDVALAPIAATTLSTIGSGTADTSTVTVTNAIAISGTVAEVTAALVTTASKVTAATATVALSDVGTAAAADLDAINTKTSGVVTAAGVTTLTGTAVNIVLNTAAMGTTIMLAGLTTLQPSDAVTANQFSTSLFTQDTTITLANVASNVFSLSASGNTVAPGKILHVDGSALSGSNTLAFTGFDGENGIYNVTGGLGGDTFNFIAGTGLVAKHTIDGGAGTDTVALTTDTAVAATDFDGVSNIESITIGNTGTNVSITTKDQLVSSGATLSMANTGNANPLTFNGSAETDGTFSITGAAGVDVITGGAGADTISGAAGADTITTGTGADTVRMVAADAGDTISDFAVASDFFDYNTALKSIDAAVTTPSALTAYQAAAAGTALAVTTTVFELTGVTTGGTAANLVTALGATATNVALAAGDTILFVNYLTAGGAQIWEFVESATAGQVASGELTLLVTLTGVVADSMVAANFI